MSCAEERLLGGALRMELEGGLSLRLLTAMELLGSRRAAQTLICEDCEAALCANACLLALALERDGAPVFVSGEAVLSGLSVSQIMHFAALFADFERSANPGLSVSAGELDALKKAWSTRLLRAFAGVCSALLARCRRRSV